MTKLTLHLTAAAAALAIIDDMPPRVVEEKLNESFKKTEHNEKDWTFWKQEALKMRQQYIGLNKQPADSTPAPAVRQPVSVVAKAAAAINAKAAPPKKTT